MKTLPGISLAVLLGASLCAGVEMRGISVFQREGSDLQIFSGSADLPAGGFWSVDTAELQDSVGRIYVDAEDEVWRQLQGNRMGEVVLKENINQGRSFLFSLQSRCERYARTNGFCGPSSIDVLGTNSWVVSRAQKLPWADVPEEKRTDGSYVYLVPDVMFEFADSEDRWSRATNETLLAFELRPYLDDGKHWVLYANHICRREPVDPALLEKYGVDIQPVYTRKELFPDAPDSFVYSFIMAAPDGVGDSILLPMTNEYTGASMDLTWPLTDVGPGDEGLWEAYREGQAMEWSQYWDLSESPTLAAWITIAGEEDWLVPPRRRAGRGETTSVFGVMGGYAAIRETLQMQMIAPSTNDTERTVAIDSIQGVEVASHPYEEMLAGRAGGRLALADAVSPDRFFVYIQKPESMLPMLNDGADFVARIGSARSGNSVRYFLKERYLQRLGLTEPFLETILQSGVIAECALVAPDLFFLDGTDVTVVSRLTAPEAVKPLLGLIGVSPEKADVLELTLADGESVFWAMKDDLLWVSTSRDEVTRSMALVGSDGAGSLGASAEFRYMLTKLPVEEQTRMFAYCSDPFIRRLVGPQVKIAQLRRAGVRALQHRVTAAAWLARLDGLRTPGDLTALKAAGYLPETLALDGISLDEQLVADSQVYGAPSSLIPLSVAPVELATQAEANAYSNYVASYSRFWRQFFDPIAFRVNDTADDGLEAELFILPLIDSSIYNGLRGGLVSHEDAIPLHIPEMNPEPVLRFSVNLGEMAWRGVGEALRDMLTQFVFVDSAILDDLGSSVHLMVHDADPVISLGSGDMLGAFGSGMGDAGELYIPVALSILTRPCTLAIETASPAKTKTYLRNATHSSGSDWGISSEFYQVGDADRWVCLFDAMGTVRLRFGLEVQGNYLLIRNIPWSNQDRIISTKPSALNAAALSLQPGAVELQLPGLHSTAAEQGRKAALQGMGLLVPLVQSGQTVAQARELHLAAFGYTPFTEAGDRWSWEDRVLKSDLYGSVYRKKQPAHRPGDAAFGLLGVIEDLDLSFRFEDDGLRARMRWKTR